MPAAIAIPAIIGAAGVGASIYGANKASNAAQSAAAQQQASIDKAQQFQQNAFNQQQQALSPYRQAGQTALANLMARQYGGSPAQYGLPSGYGGAPAQPPAPHGFPSPGGGAGLVAVQDDTGETRHVPQGQAQLYAQRGFKVLG